MSGRLPTVLAGGYLRPVDGQGLDPPDHLPFSDCCVITFPAEVHLLSAVDVNYPLFWT